MSFFPRTASRHWLWVPVCALGFLFWGTHARMLRVEAVSGLVGRARPVDVPDAGSPTGYANGQRELIVPEGHEASFHWIAQTQQMFARGEARVRHVDYENIPNGHDVSAPSPYRWWLGGLAWVDHSLTGRPVGLSVERAALYSDPLLHGLLVAFAAALVAWRFGAFAAALLSIGLVTLFPFASGFLPGMPDAHGLARACAFGSILLLVVGTKAPASGAAGPWFALAGVAGGLGLWISVPTQVPVTAGLVVGALGAVGMRCRSTSARSAGWGAASWRVWGYSGGLTVLTAYLAEYFPANMGAWTMDSVHPAYGLGLIGAGELVATAVRWSEGGRPRANGRQVLGIALAAAALATVPAVMWKTGSWGFLAKDPDWALLTGLPGGAAAASSWAWLVHDGFSPAAWATFLPLVALVPAVWLMLRRATAPDSRAALAVALGPVLFAAGFAFVQLSWWSVVDATLLALLAVAAAEDVVVARVSGRWIWTAVALAVAIPGAAQVMPRYFRGDTLNLTPPEAEELIERHLGHWLARRAGENGLAFYAPPRETTGLCFYGGLKGFGTFSPDNKAGFGVSLNMAAVPSMEEAQSDLQARGVRYIIVPSWDSFFDDFARLYLDARFSGRPNFFVGELRRWNLPLWLMPVPYQIPVGGGFAGQSVLIFEVVDEQSPADAAARLAEYLIEMGSLDKAATVAEGLRRYPGDLGALAARAEVESARGDAGASSRTMDSLFARLTLGGDKRISWDRRVSLAIVLAQAGRTDLSRQQTARCVADLTEGRLRSLSTGSLYNLLVLSHSFGVEISDPFLHELALDLLPDDVRSRL